MTQARGSASQIIFDEESTFGSDPDPVAAMNCPFETTSLGLTQNFIERNTITSSRHKKKPRVGNKDVSGDIVVELNNHHHAYLLKHLMGSVTTTGSDPYEHEMIGGTLPTSLVIETGFTDIDQYLKYNGCRIGGANFTFPQEGIIKATFRVMGADMTRGASSMEDSVTSDTDQVFDGFDASINEGGSSIATVTEVTLDVDNSLDGDSGYVIGGSGVRTGIPEGMQVVTGNLSAQFHDETLLDKALNSTETSLTITLTRDANNSIVFKVPEMIYEVPPLGVDGDGGIVIDLPFRGYYDDNTDEAALVITVENDIATL